jgi:hypothetical protein
MLIRFFLALLALLTGLSPAQSAVPIASAQTAVGVARVMADGQSVWGLKQKTDVNFGKFASISMRSFAHFSMALPECIVAKSPTVYRGDRQRI